nr:PREDICTED: uncharacterized protein LOC105663701 [Megachile rotundata]
MYPGIHNVRYIASDAAGNRAECHFSIHVRESDHRRDSEPRYYRRRMLMCPGRPPQPIPSTAYGWQIPNGCYLRYTRIFSGAYAAQNYRGQRQNGYQEANAAYHEVHPIHGSQGHPQLPRSYPIGDYRHPRQYQQQQQRFSRTDHIASTSTHYGRGRVETRILPRRRCCA